jgi:hypothetical protein
MTCNKNHNQASHHRNINHHHCTSSSEQMCTFSSSMWCQWEADDAKSRFHCQPPQKFQSIACCQFCCYFERLVQRPRQESDCTGCPSSNRVGRMHIRFGQNSVMGHCAHSSHAVPKTIRTKYKRKYIVKFPHPNQEEQQLH